MARSTNALVPVKSESRQIQPRHVRHYESGKVTVVNPNVQKKPIRQPMRGLPPRAPAHTAPRPLVSLPPRQFSVVEKEPEYTPRFSPEMIEAMRRNLYTYLRANFYPPATRKQRKAALDLWMDYWLGKISDEQVSNGIEQIGFGDIGRFEYFLPYYWDEPEPVSKPKDKKAGRQTTL